MDEFNMAILLWAYLSLSAVIMFIAFGWGQQLPWNRRTLIGKAALLVLIFSIIPILVLTYPIIFILIHSEKKETSNEK